MTNPGALAPDEAQLVPRTMAQPRLNPISGPALAYRNCKNGQPVFIRQQWKSSTKDKGCMTAWWECNSRVPLHEPPTALSSIPELALGDLFCDRVVGVDTPRLWIWAAVGDKPLFWRPIAEGDIREDGRRLSITPKLKCPSWVNADWCVKQMVKHHRGQSIPRN
ncbi:hypothetical protein C8Q79DRAFT_927957 [Trametes meyenii]|nr:hypothetical protein C8Q79DRAFT_927957 [Trametes meyenii]